ncbi:DUF4157 domain-containing protein [Dyella tabacisoli]|uniref:DUF4157 domain-containing protein n=1 Tax=Dyella tabacisoli TaxID=2282381 RepID=A0A369UTZ1_9GAMM|nr:DUF4157 domain-containing protein [Dyella tabacisoli]RDD83188.1 DUF4157 domain-containing protein [Dyella tabacisoli]
MRTFAQKPNATKQTTSTKSTIPTRYHSGQSSAVRSIFHLPRTIGNEADQRMLQADAQEHEAGLIGPALPWFGHDFSRIPIHSPSAGATQTELANNNPGDEYEQEAGLIAEHVMRISKSELQPQSHDFAGAAQAAPAIDRWGHRQCKPLEIGATDDPFEREADQVAEHVMRAPAGDPPHISTIGSSTAGAREAAPPIVGDVLGAAGEPLAPATRAFFEPKFGYDFASIRLHANDRAARSADATHARAYTVGDNIVFGRNQYQPETGEGRRLLAHELTHSIQQSGHSRVMREPKAVVHPSVMPDIADKFTQLYAKLSPKERYRLYRNITIAIGVVTEKSDTEANEPRYVYTLSGNASSKEIDAAADQLGLTRWKPSARTEGRGAVGAPNDAEQLLEGGAETNHFDVWAVGVNRRLCTDCALHMGDAEIPAQAFPDGAFRQGGALWKYQPPAGGGAGEGDSETAVVATGGQGKPGAPPKAQGDVEPPSGTPPTATKASGGAGAPPEHESGETTPATGGAGAGSQVGLHIGLGVASVGLSLLAGYLKARVDAKIAQKQIDALLHVAGQRINAHPDEALKKMMFAPEVTTYAWVFLNSSVITFFEANAGPEPITSDSSPMIDIDSINYAYQPVDPSIPQNFLSGISGGGHHMTTTRTLIIDIPLVTPSVEDMFEYAKAHDIWLGGLRDYVMYRLQKSVANFQVAVSDLEQHRGTQKDIDKADLQNRYWQDLADRILAAEKKQTASAH